MLKSRRGILAAGLAVAVVGALGAAWTVNAGAETITGATTGTAEEVVDETTEATDTTPPAILPWGARPEPVRKGRAGVNSKSLRAAGLDAAPNDLSGSQVPRGRYAPKGRSSAASTLRSETTDVTPPAPPSGSAVAPEPASTATTTASRVVYLYNVGSQAAETDGFYVNATIGRPTLARTDYHTLAELALQSADGQQIVEVGWNVDRVVNGDDDPHLFVYHWVNRTPSCYNGCGFVQYSRTIKPGDTLAYGVGKRFGIQYSGGAWWIAFDSEWVGYFPEQLWNDEGVDFTRSGLVQTFGEVAATTDRPCTQMGTGQAASTSGSAAMGSTAFLNGPLVNLNVRSTTDVYPVNQLSLRTFRYGGPGAC